MKEFKTLLAALSMVMLFSCSDSGTDQKQSKASGDDAANQVKAYADRAKKAVKFKDNVEKDINKAMDKHNKSLDEKLRQNQ
ncbi:MAG: hypothetical protein D6B27_12160 [Gammaproteobacteria bacterium]|nr:MAG: hypothetical protein D6B27_12160 [Gammaproteobacteria bacterium]